MLVASVARRLAKGSDGWARGWPQWLAGGVRTRCGGRAVINREGSQVSEVLTLAWQGRDKGFHDHLGAARTSGVLESSPERDRVS